MSLPIGPFHILEITASGSYGAVAVARPEGDPDAAPIALKVLREGASRDPKLVQRSRDEARLLYRLAHPNIVRVERLIEVRGRPVVVMEWVRGVSLRQLLEREGAPPLAVCLEVARQAAMALVAAYNSADEGGRRLSIIHRDIKPSNVLLDVDGCVKVVDFGIARGDFSDREAETQLTLLGTAGYIAPERREGRDRETPAVDVYGLGVTLFELLLGRSLLLPLEVDDHDGALRSQIAEAAVSLGAHDGSGSGPAARCTRSTLALVERMCAADPDSRPEASAVVGDLAGIGQALEVAPDLRRYAAERVRPLWEARPLTPPRAHPDYREFAFLEHGWEHAAEARDRADHGVPHFVITQRETANRRLRRFLGDRGWEDRTRQLSWLLATNPDWSPEPFLERITELQRTPWWQVWRRREVAAQLTQCLHMLRYRRTQEVLERAEVLSRHRDGAVVAAARSLLGLSPALGAPETDPR